MHLTDWLKITEEKTNKTEEKENNIDILNFVVFCLDVTAQKHNLLVSACMENDKQDVQGIFVNITFC